jgi:hypothetical protein
MNCKPFRNESQLIQTESKITKLGDWIMANKHVIPIIYLALDEADKQEQK